MSSKVDIGIIGAMDSEIAMLLEHLTDRCTRQVGGITFHSGIIGKRRVVIAKCGIGKVFAAMCAQAMILTYCPDIIINTGVGGAIECGIRVGDIVIGSRLVQHDMDTSAIGDPVGLISGINVIYFDCDEKNAKIMESCARELSLSHRRGIIASGDQFIADKGKKELISERFDASVCEMEGAAIAHVAYVNRVPFLVIRAISDSADESSSMDYMQFLPIAAKNSASLTLKFIEKY